MLLKLVYDTDHAEADALPCVMLLSGADCPHESYMWLASRLAEAGCAVALSSCVVPFGPGTCILSTPFDLSALGSLESYQRNPARAGLEALRAALASFETPRLDLSRLAVGGHSSGGRTALDVAAFDNDLGARAVFSYGASLVNSGMGSFAPRGSVLPCDAKAPPPLLLLGGSEDGVSAALSDVVRTRLHPAACMLRVPCAGHARPQSFNLARLSSVHFRGMRRSRCAEHSQRASRPAPAPLSSAYSRAPTTWPSARLSTRAAPPRAQTGRSSCRRARTTRRWYAACGTLEPRARTVSHVSRRSEAWL